MHSKYPAALNLQARVMYHTGDADAAVALQLKALAYFEQLEGLDSSPVSFFLHGMYGVFCRKQFPLILLWATVCFPLGRTTRRC